MDHGHLRVLEPHIFSEIQLLPLFLSKESALSSSPWIQQSPLGSYSTDFGASPYLLSFWPQGRAVLCIMETSLSLLGLPMVGKPHLTTIYLPHRLPGKEAYSSCGCFSKMIIHPHHQNVSSYRDPQSSSESSRALGGTVVLVWR